jgi:hypothetical protein
MRYRVNDTEQSCGRHKGPNGRIAGRAVDDFPPKIADGCQAAILDARSLWAK